MTPTPQPKALELADSELLKRAADAAGYQYDYGRGCVISDCIPWRWNPLSDDGDALRLAMSLNIHVFKRQQTVRAIWFGGRVMEDIDGNLMKATRRAIVRAASEIGESRK